MIVALVDVVAQWTVILYLTRTTLRERRTVAELLGVHLVPLDELEHVTGRP